MPDTLELPQTASEASKPVNWDIVKALYLQGIPHSEIAKQTGTSVHAIRCRAYRLRWSQTPNADSPATPASYNDLINEFQFNMAISVVAASQAFANKGDISNVGKDSRDWEIARQTLIQSGRMLFGLDKDDRRSPWTGTQGNVIDVTATAVTLKSNDTKS